MSPAELAGWLEANSEAQSLGMILHKFPQFTFETLGKLSLMQARFLSAWAWWHHKQETHKK
jgi:hypothetical protein